MSGSKKFVLDANVFIEAKDRYYGFDICPGFWNALIREHKSRNVCSIDRVRSELVRSRRDPDDEPDRLSDWVKDQGQRTLSSFACKDLHQEVDVPAGHASLHDVTVFARMLLDQTQRHPSQPG